MNNRETFENIDISNTNTNQFIYPPEDNNQNTVPEFLDSINKSNTFVQKNIKNLYQSIGTRVSKLREVNEEYEKKILNQNTEIKNLDAMISEKQKLLEEIRFHKANLQRGFEDNQLKDMKERNNLIKYFNKEKVSVSVKESQDFFKQKYLEILNSNRNKKDIIPKINSVHIENDPSLIKVKKEKERELYDLQNKLNTILKKTETVKKEIDSLRLENYKNSANLKSLIEKKKIQTEEMDKISKEANKYLLEKGNVNKELIKLNEKIDNQKLTYENKMKELNKMIENTKKMKEFHETLAIEKFSKTSNTFKKNNLILDNNENNNRKPLTIIQEEQQAIEELEDQLKKKKQTSVYLNFNRLILLKKQSKLKEIIKKVRNQTGIENLDKLSEYLEISRKTNQLFATDLNNLEIQKKDIENKIETMKVEIQNVQNKVNDTTTKKNEYINNLKDKLKEEEANKDSYDKRLYTLNRMIDIIAVGFKDICLKLNFRDELLNSEMESSESLLTKCMDLLETKIIEIIQLNQDPLKENNLDGILNNDDNINKYNIIQKAMENLYNDETVKNIYSNSKNIVVNPDEIKNNAKLLVDNCLKKYEKINN